jgi:protein SCO1
MNVLRKPPNQPPFRSEMRVIALLSLALLASTAAASAPAQTSSASPALKAGTFTPARQAPDFSLKGSDGTDLTLDRYRGKVVVLGFGFTSCPDVCPTTLGTLAQARRDLGPAAAGVQVIYITVDPERDDAEQLENYLRGFDKTFLGGTGTREQLAAVHKQYGVQAEKHAFGKDHSYSHSSFTYLIDRSGKLRALMPYGHAPADYTHDLKLLLKE